MILWHSSLVINVKELLVIYILGKKYIFVELEYWKLLYVKHNLDVCILRKMYMKASLVLYLTFQSRQMMDLICSIRVGRIEFEKIFGTFGGSIFYLLATLCQGREKEILQVFVWFKGFIWVDNKHSVTTDGLGFTCVNLHKLGHKSEPFILASQGK